jgi:hypothetical protein
MKEVADKAIELQAVIICPKFGAGLAGGSWLQISGLIEELWVKKGIDVTVYTID